MNNTDIETPLINEEGTGMTVDLKNYGDTEIVFNGTTGMIVLQYVFDVESVSVFPKTVLTDCFIRINVTVSVNEEDGRLVAVYSIDEASTVEEYISEDEITEDGAEVTEEGTEEAEVTESEPTAETE